MRIDTIPMTSGDQRFGCDLDIADAKAVAAFEAEYGTIDRTALGVTLRTTARGLMLKEVDRYRRRLSGAEAGIERPGPERIGIWAAKARLARAYRDDPEAMPDTLPGFFRSRLTREAGAAGRTLADQLERIAFKADTFEGLGLLVDAMEAEVETGLAAITDEQGLAGGFDAYLAAVRQEADTAFADGLAALQGDQT